MKKHLFLIAGLAIGMAACTNDVLTPEDNADIHSSDQTTSTLITSQLKSFNASTERVVLEPQTRADDYPYPIKGSITLISSLDNLSKEGKINGFEYETGNEDARYLSATCVYYDDINKKYYVTYHMQGNNYATQLEDQTSGYIESFEVDEDGNIKPGEVYQAANPAELDFDFNHLFFDDLNDTDHNGNYSGSDSGMRLIAVGHTSEPTRSGKREYKAMIAKLNLQEGKIEHSIVYTGDKILDENGKSLGKEDASDVNSVIRKYNYYYLSTRKGIAVLNAKNDNMFSPIPNYEYDENGENYHAVENSVYFIKTPGSAKHFCNYYPSYGSGFSFLYLTQPFPASYDGNTKLPASLINFSMNAGDGTLCGMNTTDSQTTGKAIFSSKDFDITTWSLGTNQFPIKDDLVYPIDGKNVVANLNGRLYACLGKGGLYVRKSLSTVDGPTVVENTIKFSDAKDGTGSRSVNGVFVEDVENYNDGFIYVANGSCLTILDRETLKQVAEFSLYKKGEIEDASANYVHVRKTNTYTGNCPDRIITVAYGQQGVKVFRFVPPSREKTVTE